MNSEEYWFLLEEEYLNETKINKIWKIYKIYHKSIKENGL